MIVIISVTLSISVLFFSIFSDLSEETELFDVLKVVVFIILFLKLICLNVTFITNNEPLCDIGQQITVFIFINKLKIEIEINFEITANISGR